MEKDELKIAGYRKLSYREMVGRTLAYIKPEIWSFVLAGVLLLINVAIGIYLPMWEAKIVGFISDENFLVDDTLINHVLGYGLQHIVFGVISFIILYFEAMVLQKAGQRIILKLRVDVFSHIESMSQNQLNEMPVGSLVTRVCSYTSTLSNLFTNTLINLLKDGLTVIGVYGMMIYISISSIKLNPEDKNAIFLPIILLGFAIIVLIASLIFGKIVSKIFKQERRLLSELNTFLNENLSGMKVIQVFNQEKRKEEEFEVKNEAYRKERYKVTIAFGIYRPFISFLYIMSEATIFYFGIKAKLSAESIMAFYLYLSRFFNPIQNLADQLNNIQQAFSSAEKLYNLLDVKAEVLDKENALEIEHFAGKIEFRHVWFAYKEEEWILKDVSFVIEPKQTVAFVGATGAGKTTILSLIVRNFDIQKGEILIDDINIMDIKIESLRKAIGQMLQDVFLFTGSIKSNITLKDERFTDDEVLEVCHYVNADCFINKLPDKLEAKVIERGENFSQGERQLLSFARTVIHKPQILILDEATANIDTETEVLIQDSLNKMRNIGTMLVVAHRLSTIQHSDQIIVLQNGEIIERGTHQDLLKNRGYYYKLYELQFNADNK